MLLKFDINVKLGEIINDTSSGGYILNGAVDHSYTIGDQWGGMWLELEK